MTTPNIPRRRSRLAVAGSNTPTRRRSPIIGAGEPSNFDLSAIEAAAEALLADVGIACRLPADAAATCAKGGLVVNAERVRFPMPLVMEHMAKAPDRFLHVSSTDARTLEVSTSMAAFGPALAAHHKWDGATRCALSAIDARLFAAIADDAGFEYGGSSLSLLTTDATHPLSGFIGTSNRPLIAPANLPFHARDLISVACRGASKDAASCHLMMIGAVESALTFDDVFIEALLETAASAQGLIVAPTLLIGANAPATVEGTLVRFATEAMAGIALAQALCPGQPVAVGATIADVSMRNGLPLVGTANALAVLSGAITLARRWNVAFYALGPATNAKGLDALGTAETSRWLTSAYYLGANAIVGAIGAVDLDDGISVEKLIVDAEVAAVLGRPHAPLSDDPAAELRQSGAGGVFLGTTAARDAAHRQSSSRLAENSLYESWVAAGNPTINQAIAAIIAAATPPNWPSTVEHIAVAQMKRRPTNLADLASTLYSRSIRDAFGFGG